MAKAKNFITITNIHPLQREWVEKKAKDIGVSMGAILKKMISESMEKDGEK